MHFGSSAYNYPSNVSVCVQVHLGEMATLLGYGRQSCRTAVISLNYGVFFHIINISFQIKCIFPEMVRDFSGTLYVLLFFIKLIVLNLYTFVPIFVQSVKRRLMADAGDQVSVYIRPFSSL